MLLMLGLPGSALKLTGGVEYTVETAREEAFAGVVYQIPVSTFSKYMRDPDYADNQNGLKLGKEDLGDRWITKFSDGSYMITYKKDKYKSYTYETDGKLSSYGIKTGIDYVEKVYDYDLSGKLFCVALYVRYNEIYGFNIDGTLDYHWIGDNCYDINGKVTLKRLY